MELDEEDKKELVQDYLSEQDAEEAVELVPDEVLEAARAEGREEAREQAAELKDAAADDADRALEALIEGKSVDEVKDETIEDLKGRVEDAGDGTAGVSYGPSDAEGAEEERREERGMDEDEEETPRTREEAEERIQEVQSEKDCSRADAIRHLSSTEPETIEALRG